MWRFTFGGAGAFICGESVFGAAGAGLGATTGAAGSGAGATSSSDLRRTAGSGAGLGFRLRFGENGRLE